MVEDFFNLIHPKLNTHPNHFLGGLISFLTEKSQVFSLYEGSSSESSVAFRLPGFVGLYFWK